MEEVTRNTEIADGRERKRVLRVDVIIPTYKPGKKFSRLLKMLSMQTYPIGKIIVMNTEKAYWNDKGFEGIGNLEVHHLSKEEFDHGATRNRGARCSRADIMVFMTDLDELGIKTFFASNVCCAYDREKFWFQGGFIHKTIFNEDMIFAGKAVLQDDYAIAYVAEARVIHSHNYGCAAQFRRNFDLAVSQADHPEVFAGIHSEGEGIRLVRQTARYLVTRRRPWLVPGLIVKSGFKYAGYRLGRCYRFMPVKLAAACSMNKEYWK